MTELRPCPGPGIYFLVVDRLRTLEQRLKALRPELRALIPDSYCLMNMVFFAKADLSSKRLFHMKSGVTMNICSLSLDRH